MKTAMKKLFSLMLVAVLLIGAMPFQAFADEIPNTFVQVYIDGAWAKEVEIEEGHYTAESLAAVCNVGPYDSVIVRNYTINKDSHVGDPAEWIGKNYNVQLHVDSAAAPVCDNCGEAHATTDCDKDYCSICNVWGNHDDAAHCGTCGQLGHAAADHCTECDKVECICCDTCNKYPCVCKASVEILVKVDNVDGYTNEGTFQMGAGAKSANAIYSAAGYNKNTVLSYCVTDVNGGNKAVFDETIELTAGGSYILWLEVAPASTTPEPTPAVCEECGAELLNGMCTGCYLDEGDCNCNETTEPESQKGKVKLVLDFNYKGAKDTVMYVERNAKLNSVIAGIPAPTRDGHLFSHWTLDAEGKRPIGRDDLIGKQGVTIYAQWDDNLAQWDDNLAIGGDLTVRVNLNYDRKMADSLKNIVKGTKMGSVLDYVNTPYRWGYKFVGWYWDAKGRNDVEWHDEVLKDCEIFAKWERVHNETMLKIYINGDTHNVAKIVDLHDYAKDGWISKDEVKAVVKQYYTAKDSDGLTFYGLFDAENWKSFVRNKNHGGEKHIEVNAGSDTTVYVMVHNAKAYSSSSSTADASNPKTGDMIMTPVIVLGASAACLAALFYLNKKRAV